VSILFWPLLLFFGLVVFVVVTMIGLSYFLGQRHTGLSTGQPYESGMITTGSARLRFDVKFYLNAMFFVIFDLEAAFIFAWAIAFRQVGWAGYIEMLVFVGILIAALIYLWKLGALDWSTLLEKLGRQRRERKRSDEVVVE
jgi:NADH-quinone oxidoreductase subunit A